MARNSFRALCIYFIIYAIAQGIMDAYEEALEQPFLDHHGVSIELVGVAQTIDFLPWCFKFVWAIPSDSYNFLGFGHRRPYVVLGILLGFAAFFALTQFDPGQYLWAYMICMSIRNIGVAIADCAVDGLSVDCQMDTEAGAISGWMSLGRTAGTVLAAIVATKIAADNGDNYSLGIMVSAFFMFIPVPANWFIKEEWVDEVAYEDKLDAAAGTEVSKKAAVAAANAAFSNHTKLDSGSHGGSGMGSSNMTMAEAAAIVRKELEEEERRKEAGLPAHPTSGGTLDHSHDTSTMGKVYGLKRLDSFKKDKEDAHAIMSETESIEKAKKALKRRKSFVAKVAENVGFDWDMLHETLSKKHVYLFLWYLLLTNGGVAMANFSLTAWAHEERGFHIDEVGIVMSVMSIGCFMASLPMGYAFDLIPNKRSTMFFAAFSCGLCNTALLFCKTKPEVYVGLWGFGAAHGVIYVVQCSMARILADVRIAAAFFGIVNSTYNISHALGTLIGGPVAGAFGLEANFLLGAIISFIAVPFCFLLPEEALRVSREDAGEGKMKVLKHRMEAKKVESRKTALNTTALVLEQADDLTKARLKALTNFSHNPAFGVPSTASSIKVGAYVVQMPGAGPSAGSDPTSFTPSKHVHTILPPGTPQNRQPAPRRAHDYVGIIQPTTLDDVVRRNPAYIVSAASPANPHKAGLDKVERSMARKPSMTAKMMAKIEDANEPQVVAPRSQQPGGQLPEPTWLQRALGATVEPPKSRPSHVGKYRRNSAAAAANLARQTGLPLEQVAGPRPPLRDGEASVDTDSTEDPAVGTEGGGPVVPYQEPPQDRHNPFPQGSAAPQARAQLGTTSSTSFMLGMARQQPKYAVVDFAPTNSAVPAGSITISSLPVDLGEAGNAVARNPLRPAASNNGAQVYTPSVPSAATSAASTDRGSVDRRARMALMGVSGVAGEGGSPRAPSDAPPVAVPQQLHYGY